MARRLDGKSAALNFSTLVTRKAHPLFDPKGKDKESPQPDLAQFLPPKPNAILMMLPVVKTRYESDVQEATENYDKARNVWNSLDARRQSELSELRLQWQHTCDAIDLENRKSEESVRAFENDYRAAIPEAVTRYFSLVLEGDKPLGRDSGEHQVAYVANSRQLVVELDVPDRNVVPSAAAYKYVKKSDEIVPVKRAPTSSRDIYTSLVAQLALRALYVLVNSDAANTTDTFVLSCFVNTISPSSGRPERPCLISVNVSKDKFSEIDLRNVEPVACLRGLHA